MHWMKSMAPWLRVLLVAQTAHASKVWTTRCGAIATVKADEPSIPKSTVQHAVGVLILGKQTNSSSDLSWLIGDEPSSGFSAILFGNNQDTPHYRMSALPKNEKTMAAIGLICDTLIVALPPNEEGDEALDKLAENLLEISYERQRRSLHKGRLVIVAEAAHESSWVNDIVKRRLASVTPALWEFFDVVTPSTLRKQWINGIVAETGHIYDLLPHVDNGRIFAKLLQRVYLSIGGVMESEADFELQSIPVAKTSFDTPLREEAPTMPSGEDPQDRIQQVLSDAQSQLAELESKMQELQLDSQSSNQLPLLDFGSRANNILEQAYKEFHSFPPSLQTGFMSRLVLEVHRLYSDHIQLLRDYYGRRYEAALETEEEEGAWAAKAEHVTQGFQAAAHHAVPVLCQPEAFLANVVKFEFVQCLGGLIKDMMEATQLRKDEQSLAFEEDDIEDLSPSRSPIPKWVKKLASRTFVLGINYLQGWLAWQGIKRAALERDREMPKFPLF